MKKRITVGHDLDRRFIVGYLGYKLLTQGNSELQKLTVSPKAVMKALRNDLWWLGYERLLFWKRGFSLTKVEADAIRNRCARLVDRIFPE